MTAHYFSVKNPNNTIVIDDSYKNLYLSRKIAANTLPMEWISWNTGCYMRGSFLARRIDFLSDRDEIFAAVAAPAGQECNFFIFNSIMGNVNKAYLCAAQRVSPYGPTYWESASTTITGMNDTSYVPDGIDVFVFSKSKRGNQVYENAGLQVFDANGNCIYDSRYKSARILGGVSYYNNISPDKRIAVGCSMSEVICSSFSYPYTTYSTLICGYGTGFGTSSYYGRYYRPTYCMSLTHTVESQSQDLSFRLYNNNSPFILFDVTNF